MSVLNMPSSPEPKTSRFGLRSHTSAFQSGLTGAISQTLELPGAAWTMELTFPPMTVAQAAEWRAFFVALRGQANRFYGFDPDARTPRGAVTGSPKVDGADQTGNELDVKDLPLSTTGVFLAGDYVAYDTPVGREMRMVIENANSNGAGKATLILDSPIRNSPEDEAAIVYNDASAVMMLEEPEVNWSTDDMRYHSFTLKAIEAFQ